MPLGQATFVQAEGERVADRCGKVGEAVVQLEHENCRGRGAHRNRRVTPLQPPERIAGDEEPAGHVGGGDATLASG